MKHLLKQLAAALSRLDRRNDDHATDDFIEEVRELVRIYRGSR